VKVEFREEVTVEVDGLSGEYSPKFNLYPFMLTAESVVKLMDAADKQGVEPFWTSGRMAEDLCCIADAAIADALKQVKVKIA